MATKAKDKKQTFEQRLQALDAIVQTMETGTLSLEDSLTTYEEGMKLIEALEAQLQAAEQRLTVLRKLPDGSEVEEPFSDEETEDDEKL